MPDAPLNPPPPIPPKARPILGWVSWLLLLGGPSFGAMIALLLEGDVAKACTVLLGFMVSGAASIKGGLAVPWKKAGPVVMVLGALALAGCPGAHTAATKAAGSVMYATKTASKSLAIYSASEMDAGGDKDKICKRLRAHRDNIRPAARTSVAATYAAIRIAQEAGKDEVDYMATLKPGGCALILGLREWAHKLPDKGKAIMGWLGLFSGAACDKVNTPKSAAVLAAITALLPVAVDLVKWIISVVGASDADLMKTINAWIQGPVADEVDALIAKSCAGVP